MRIKELVQYGLDKRAIDYYTNCGLIPCTSNNTYAREYGDDAIEAVQKIAVLREAGMSAKTIEEHLNDPSYFTTSVWNEHLSKLREKRDKEIKRYDDMIAFAENMRDSTSAVWQALKEFDNFEDSKIFIGITAQINKKLRELYKTGLVEFTKNQPEDLSDLAEHINSIIQTAYDSMERGISPTSDEFQLYFQKMLQRIKKLYGVIVYFLYELFIDFDYSGFNLSEEDKAEIEIFKEMLGICADWFREKKSLEASRNTSEFESMFPERIRALDEKMGEPSIDALVEIIQEICKLPEEITPESFNDGFFRAGFDTGVNASNDACQDEYDPEVEKEIKAIREYLFEAVTYYIAKK